MAGWVPPLQRHESAPPVPHELPNAVADTLLILQQQTGSHVTRLSWVRVFHRETSARTIEIEAAGGTWRWTISPIKRDTSTRLIHIRLEDPASHVFWEGIVRFGRASPLCIETPHDGIFFIVLD